MGFLTKKEVIEENDLVILYVNFNTMQNKRDSAPILSSAFMRACPAGMSNREESLLMQDKLVPFSFATSNRLR